VWVAQQVCAHTAGESPLGLVEVQRPTQVTANHGNRDDLPSDALDRREERRIGGRVDHHTVAWACQELQHFADRRVYVGDQRHLRRVDVPVESPPGEIGERAAEIGSPRVDVPGVAGIHGGMQRGHDRLGPREIHFRDPHRQHIVGEAAPLRASSGPQVLPCQPIKSHDIRIAYSDYSESAPLAIRWR
jgi:hypothetical protein